MKWYKKEPLATVGGQSKWIRVADDREQEFVVENYLGKKTDLLGLKKNVVQNLTDQLAHFKETRTSIYHQDDMDLVDSCCICGFSSDNASLQVSIYGADYVQCQNCTHVYVKKRPSKAAIEGFYLSDITYAATYTDKKAAESRLNAIAVPWRDWLIEVYGKLYGKKPTTILDVGSGAGHFVEACRRVGLKAEGIELSESSRAFSKEVWGIELDGGDFLEVGEKYSGYDVVTFWGLLEHTPNPAQILSQAYSIVKESTNGGMVISKLPRWNSLSSAIQSICSSTVIRHLDPMGHIMCFTDQSAAELYYSCKFAPKAAWYYGMDVYELFMQMGNNMSDYNVLTGTSNIQLELQQKIDDIKFSDGLTLVGTPMDF
ncbi:MAG: class I SAM-dependent methyltransferase [Cyclobacteriaceae bacterium]